MKKMLLASLFVASTLMLGACEDDAAIASRNISKAADNFEIARQIVFYNTWTDTEVMTITGLCSLDILTDKLAVTCKEGPEKFVKHYLGRTPQLSFFAQQLLGVDVSTMHTRITWKPQTFIPDIDFRGDAAEAVRHRDTSDH